MKHPHPQRSDLDALLGQVEAKEADALREVWALAGQVTPDAGPSAQDTDLAVARLEAALHTPHDGTPAHTGRPAQPPQRHRRVIRRLFGPTALLLLLVTAGLYGWLRPVVQSAPPGEQLTVTLPDGSTVHLNSGTTLRYRRPFSQARTVHLTGEAFFSVARAEHPFVVHTFNAQVQVLGTRFNVRAWPDEVGPHTTVALETGRVALAPSGRTDEVVVMEPGQTRHIAAAAPNDGLLVRDHTLADALAWRQGDFIFKEQRLDIILDDVARRFAVELSVQPGTPLARRLSLALRQPPDAEAVVRDLALALGLRYRATARGYELYDAS